MPYKKIWVGALCISCGRPILHCTDTAWKEFTRAIPQPLQKGASKVDLCCPDPDCSAKWSHPVGKFVSFQVEEIQEAR